MTTSSRLNWGWLFAVTECTIGATGRDYLDRMGQMRHYNSLSVSGLLIALLVGLTVAPAHAAGTDRPSGQTTIVPFSGTATLTYTASTTMVPAKATQDLSRYAQVETFAVRDATHWRIDMHITAPVIVSHDETIVANGSQLVDYSTLTNQAIRSPGSVAQSAALLSVFLQSRVAPVGTTASQYPAMVKRIPREKLRSLGQTQMLGRTVDIFQISPLGWSSTGSCSGPKECASKEKGFGSETIWLDHQYGIVLQCEQHGMPKKFGGEQGYRYVVTSLTVGQGPSEAALAYVPPVPVKDIPRNTSGVSSGSSGGGPGMSFQAPPGFITVGAPVTNGGTMLVHGTGSGSEGLGGSAYVEGVFRGTPNQGFVYLREQTRALGLPGALKTGSPQAAGSCQVWTGTFPDGLTWLAMARKQIAILVVANKLTTTDLVRYAANGICTAKVVPPPTPQEVERTTLEHLETEIDITRQILGWAMAAAPSAADKSTLKGFDARLAAFDRTVFAIANRNNPGAVYSGPGFPPVGKHQFTDTLQGLKGEIPAAKAQLAAAEAAVQSPADRQTLQQGGTVFDDLVRAVDTMTTG